MPAKPDDQYVQIQSRVPRAAFARLQRLATQDYDSVSGVVRRLLCRAVENEFNPPARPPRMKVAGAGRRGR